MYIMYHEDLVKYCKMIFFCPVTYLKFRIFISACAGHDANINKHHRWAGLKYILALSHTYLNMPLFAHGIDHTAFDRPPAGSTDRHAHFIMAGETVQLSFQLPSISSQLLTVKITSIKIIYIHTTNDMPISIFQLTGDMVCHSRLGS